MSEEHFHRVARLAAELSNDLRMIENAAGRTAMQNRRARSAQVTLVKLLGARDNATEARENAIQVMCGALWLMRPGNDYDETHAELMLDALLDNVACTVGVPDEQA